MNLRAHARAHPSPLQDEEKRGRALYVVEMYLACRTGATIREMLKDLTGLDYAIVSSGGIRLSFLSISSFRRSRRQDIKVEIFSKERLYEVKYMYYRYFDPFSVFTANSVTNDSSGILILFFLGVVLIKKKKN